MIQKITSLLGDLNLSIDVLWSSSITDQYGHDVAAIDVEDDEGYHSRYLVVDRGINFEIYELLEVDKHDPSASAIVKCLARGAANAQT